MRRILLCAAIFAVSSFSVSEADIPAPPQVNETPATEPAADTPAGPEVPPMSMPDTTMAPLPPEPVSALPSPQTIVLGVAVGAGVIALGMWLARRGQTPQA